jgi:hypothetical protein
VINGPENYKVSLKSERERRKKEEGRKALENISN